MVKILAQKSAPAQWASTTWYHVDSWFHEANAMHTVYLLPQEAKRANSWFLVQTSGSTRASTPVVPRRPCGRGGEGEGRSRVGRRATAVWDWTIRLAAGIRGDGVWPGRRDTARFMVCMYSRGLFLRMLDTHFAKAHMEWDWDLAIDPHRPTVVPDPRSGSIDPGWRNQPSTLFPATMVVTQTMLHSCLPKLCIFHY
jgi:hypothetical protein